MDDLIKEHLEKFGVVPIIIGKLWNDPDELAQRVVDAIEEGKPYDEYAELTEEEKDDFANGDLVF